MQLIAKHLSLSIHTMDKSLKYSFFIFLALSLNVSGQVKNLIYVDCSSDIAGSTLDQWQNSISNELASLLLDETVVFISNKRSPLISAPNNYQNLINDLGLIRPDPPLADYDLRRIIEILDPYELANEFHLYVYTSSESFQTNVNLNRKLYDRIAFVINQYSEELIMEYYIPLDDKSNISKPSQIQEASQFNPTFIFF